MLRAATRSRLLTHALYAVVSADRTRATASLSVRGWRAAIQPSPRQSRQRTSHDVRVTGKSRSKLPIYLHLIPHPTCLQISYPLLIVKYLFFFVSKLCNVIFGRFFFPIIFICYKCCVRVAHFIPMINFDRLTLLWTPTYCVQVVPSVQHPSPAVRNEALKALGLACLLDRSYTVKYLFLLVQVNCFSFQKVEHFSNLNLQKNLFKKKKRM